MAKKNNKERYIVIAGNMGVGKSSLAQFFKVQFDAFVYYEPVDENPYFNKFFKDMKKWSFHTQLYFLAKKFEIHKNMEDKKGLVVIDRSIYEDAEIFAQSLFDAKMMSKDDFNLYITIYRSMLKGLRPPDLVIYLTASIDVLMDRVYKRGRKEEKTVEPEYILQLQAYYDAWVKNFSLCPVVALNTDNLDYISDMVHKEKIIEVLAKLL